MKMDVFKTDQKVNIHLGYLSKKMCQQELSKIAQSGHTAFLSHLSLNINIFLLFCDLEYQQQQQLLLLAVVEKGPRFLVELKARSVYNYISKLKDYMTCYIFSRIFSYHFIEKVHIINNT